MIYAQEHAGIWGHPIVVPDPPTPLAKGPTGDRSIFTTTVRLDRTAARDPATVRAAKEKLAVELDRFVDRRGYTVVSVRPVIADPPRDATGAIELRLEAVVEPRHDGEWDDIRRAVAEDEDDRAEAKRQAGLAAPVNDRLDALAASVAYWGDRGLRGL